MSKKKESNDLENDFLDDYIDKNFLQAVETLTPYSLLLFREEVRKDYGFQAYALKRAIYLCTYQ